MYCERRITVLVFILFSFLVRTPAQSESVEEVEEWLVRGNLLIQKAKYLEAAEIFSQRKQESPLDHRAYFYSGMALVQIGDLSAAAADLKEALLLHPADAQYKILYANVLARLEHGVEALDVLAPFQNQWNVEPLVSSWMLLLSETFNSAGDYNAALRVLDLLVQRHPDNARFSLNRGQIHLNMGNYEKARASLENSLNQQPSNNPAAYFYLGKALLQLGENKAAKRSYLEAIDQDPDNTEYLWKLGAVCLTLGDYKEAIGYLERAEPAAAEFPEIYYVLARAYQAVDEREKSAENFKRFRDLSDENREQHYKEVQSGELVGRGEDALEQNDTAKAQDFFEQALQQNPDSWAAHGYLAEIYLAHGSLYQAYGHLVRMEKIAPDTATGQFLMARYWYERRDYQRARSYAEKVREARPSNSGLRNLLGNIYLALDQVTEAVKEYSIAVELDPEKPELKRNLEAARKRLQ